MCWGEGGSNPKLPTVSGYLKYFCVPGRYAVHVRAIKMTQTHISFRIFRGVIGDLLGDSLRSIMLVVRFCNFVLVCAYMAQRIKFTNV